MYLLIYGLLGLFFQKKFNILTNHMKELPEKGMYLV